MPTQLNPNSKALILGRMVGSLLEGDKGRGKSKNRRSPRRVEKFKGQVRGGEGGLGKWKGGMGGWKETIRYVESQVFGLREENERKD